MTGTLTAPEQQDAAPCQSLRVSTGWASVSVLFARADSVYKTLGADVWDAERDALKWTGGAPVVAHPPCRAWGELKHMAKPRPGERRLALWAVCVVRAWGGVLEHPAKSELWPVAGLPEPGERDAWGGWTLVAPQMWWGHRAEKPTRFYVCGIEPEDVPPLPFVLGDAPCIIGTPGRRRAGSRLRPGEHGYRPEISKNEREHTHRPRSQNGYSRWPRGAGPTPEMCHEPKPGEPKS